MGHTTSQVEQPLKRQNVGDRRKSPRFDASAIPGFKSINLVGGPEVKIINISRRGALVEIPEYLPLDSSISLQIITAEGVHIIKGRIVGRTIHYRTSSRNDQMLQYQSAVSFDEDFRILPLLM